MTSLKLVSLWLSAVLLTIMPIVFFMSCLYLFIDFVMLSSIYLHTYNPVNVRWSVSNNWIGQVGAYRGFVSFDTPAHGYRAAMVLIANYIRNGFDTVSKIIPRFAPPSENDTRAYLSRLSKYIDLDAIIDPYTYLFYDLICRIAFIETGSIVDIAYLVYLTDKFKLC